MNPEIQDAVASTFARHVNSIFRFQHEPAATELELVEVSDGSAGQHINFSLLFRGPHQPALRQQIYPVEHDRLGRFDLFIVPIKRDAQGLKYEAVFNRGIESAASAE
jgi:hypothetical protein